MQISEDKIEEIGRILQDQTKSLQERFRALFSLKNIGGEQSIKHIAATFGDPSALLKHELAYCLGQMQDAKAFPILVNVLEDQNQEGIVRHEAAEALGALGLPEAIPVLQKFVDDDVREVRETCILALDRFQWISQHKTSDNKYQSVDPAPPSDIKNIEELSSQLLNENLSLFERYRAMFALRDLDTPDSALALTKGLKTDSALFSHEIAFVLGQLQNPNTIDALVDCLDDESQSDMVRHECAEALGAIATEPCWSALKAHLSDKACVVRESCELALDVAHHNNSDEFQYAIV